MFCWESKHLNQLNPSTHFRKLAEHIRVIRQAQTTRHAETVVGHFISWTLKAKRLLAKRAGGLHPVVFCLCSPMMIVVVLVITMSIGLTFLAPFLGVLACYYKMLETAAVLDQDPLSWSLGGWVAVLGFVVQLSFINDAQETRKQAVYQVITQQHKRFTLLTQQAGMLHAVTVLLRWGGESAR